MRTLRHGWRQLWRNPGFAVAAVGSLALGIGANVAIFTLANALLLRPLQVRAPSELIRVTSVDTNGNWGPLIAPMVDEIRRTHVFDGVCGFLSPQFTVEVDGRRSPMAMHAVSGDCLATLGLHPIIGRLLTPDDDHPLTPGAVVLAYEMWQREFGGSPTALGRTLRIEAGTFTIVGVVEPSFDGLMVGFPPRLFFPLRHIDPVSYTHLTLPTILRV